jgi:hypothetical protein
MRDISAICPLRLLSRQRQSTQTIPVAALPVPGSSAPGCLCASTRPGSSQLSAASSAPRTGSSVHWSPSANKSATSPPGRVAPRDGHQTTLTATIGDNEAAVGFPNRLFGPLSVVVLRPGQLQARPAAASRPRPLPWPSPTSRPGIGPASWAASALSPSRLPLPDDRITVHSVLMLILDPRYHPCRPSGIPRPCQRRRGVPRKCRWRLVMYRTSNQNTINSRRESNQNARHEPARRP